MATASAVKHKVPKATKVTYSEGHDKLRVEALFPSGGRVLFTVSRAGETLSLYGSNDEEILRQQSAALTKWLKLGKKESNGDRMLRLKAVCEKANSVGQLIEAIKR